MKRYWTVSEEVDLYADELFAEEIEKRERAAQIAAEEDEAWYIHESAEHEIKCDLYWNAKKAETEYELEKVHTLDVRHVCRFMSAKEFDKLMRGEVLVNKDRHEQSRTDSVGFCFLSDDSVANGEDGSFMAFWGRIMPQDAHRYLCGVVSEERFVVFEVTKDDMNRFSQSYGIYANPFTDGWYDRISLSELSTETYDSSWLKPVRAYAPDGWDYVEIPLD